jgi:hypothetical protein
LLPSQLYNAKQIYKTPERIFDRGNTQTRIVEPGSWRGEGMPNNNISNVGSNNYSNEAKRIRDEFKEFFVTPQGEVPWQYSCLS